MIINLHHNFQRDRRGIGTIFGMVFFLLIVMVVFASFMTILNQNTSLQQTVTKSSQMGLDRANEQVTITATSLPMVSANGATVTVNCNLTNTGTLPVQIVRLWVKDLSIDTSGNLLISSSNVILQEGLYWICNQPVTVQGANSGDSFIFWFETARGNQFTLQQSSVVSGTSGGNVSQSSISGLSEIGSLLFNWSNFTYYDFGSNAITSGSTSLSQATQVRGVTVTDNHNILLAVPIFNADPSQQDVTLTRISYLYANREQTGHSNVDFIASIANISGSSSTYYSSFSAQVLKYNQTTMIYFGPISWSENLEQLNLVLFGYYSTPGASYGVSYGQNIPFVPLLFTSASGVVQIQITSNPSGTGFVTVDGNPISTPQTFSWSPGSTHILGSYPTVSGPTSTQYAWQNWSGGSFGNSTSQSYTYTVPASAETLTANYITQYQVSFASNPTAYGTTTPSGSQWANAGSIAITAASNNGYSFSSWAATGSITIANTLQAATTATINGPGTLTAGFYASLNHLTLTGSPVSTTAGQNFGSNNFQVTAYDTTGNIMTSYSGQVYYTSTDSQATLPYTFSSRYTFVPADNGVHTFLGPGFNLKTSGQMTITITDLSAAVSTTSSLITVNAASASILTVSGFPSSVTAGNPGSIIVTAKDAYGNTVTSYTGTVHISSSDAQAALPANYAFTAGDNGLHTFSNGVTLKTAGSQLITATDTVTGSITGSETGITVNPNAAISLTVTGFLSPVATGTTGSITVTAKDAYGNTATGYLGTVKITSSDGAATLPANYQFTSGNNGVYTFTNGVTLKTKGTQSITATDTVTGSITGSQSGIVVYNQVVLLSAGTGSGTTGNPTPAYPTGLQANDLIMMQVTVRDTSTTPTTPAGFTLLYGPDSSGTGRQWIYYKFATGSESGTLTVTIGNSACKVARMYAFRNVALSSFTEGTVYGSNAGSTTISAQSVATSGNGRLAVSFVLTTYSNTVPAFSGQTGGTWAVGDTGFTTTSGSRGSVQLETATMATGGTISGGSCSIGTSASWGVRAFALVPL